MKNAVNAWVVLVGHRHLEPIPRREPTEWWIKDDQIEPAVDALEDVAESHVNPVGHAVACRVGPRRLYRRRVEIDGDHVESRSGGQYRVDAAAGAHVEDSITRLYLVDDRLAEKAGDPRISA